jgi:AcrR family transcriptional regulator
VPAASLQRARGRPRDPDVDARVLAVARRLLAEKGYDALSFEAIALAAGVGKPAIYRRWPTKAHLASEIATGGGEGLPDIIAEHGLVAQIRAIVAQAVAFYGRQEMRPALLGVFASYQSGTALREDFRRLEGDTRATWHSIVAKGQAAGQIRTDIDPDTVFDMIVGSIIFRALLSEIAAPVDHVERLTDQLVKSIGL